ncbi:hypothetical protein [Paratractidigestivibacter sp.]|uniref:hypothetical protein n=1 Tax=Paratractidigestivibacter sp. TaxID=2847316 RepID=UPI002AC8CAAD|nr:hypothetical protein [Paratractidigestivibacter sp.]
MSDLKDTFDSEKAEDLAAEAVEQATDAAEDAAAEAERAAEEAAEVGAEDVADTATAVVDATDAGDEKPTAQQTVKLPVFIGVAVAALVIGLVVGAFAFGAKSVSLGGKTVLTSDQIDTVVATYSYNGKSYQITARDVLTQSGTLESVANDDGTYDVPAATDIVTYARTAAVVTAAENMGITASDDEVSSYAEEKFGSSDFSTIASTYSVDEDVAKEMIMDSCVMSKLRDEKVDVDLPDQPVAPTEPAEDATDTPTAEYASYIIGLAGDEWDSANNTWARTDGDYYAALSTYDITNDSATYAAAQAAYYVAYSDYSTAYSESTTAWSEYCNSILSNVSLSLGGLNV